MSIKKTFCMSGGVFNCSLLELSACIFHSPTILKELYVDLKQWLSTFFIQEPLVSRKTFGLPNTDYDNSLILVLQ